MIKLFLNLILFVVLSVYGAGHQVQAAEGRFFEALYDVPIMPDLSEVSEMGLSFDKVEGRIARSVAIAKNTDNKAVLGFYGEVLPQMGWRPKSPYIFVREQEKLEISFEKTKTSQELGQDGGMLVKFSLSPITR